MKKLNLIQSLACLSIPVSAFLIVVTTVWAMPAGNNSTINFNVLYDFASNPDVGGFVVYSGTSSSNYTSRVPMGLSTNFAIGGYPRNTWLFFNMTAVSTNGVESDFTGEQSLRTWNKPHQVAAFQPAQQ